MSNISLCMIVRNEAKSLPKCLGSVKDLVSEMIVVDTGSTDDTREVARGFGAKVVDYGWNDNFAEARNFGLGFVESDWVLVLDADEVFNGQLISAVEKATRVDDNLVVNLVRHEVGANSSPYSLLSRLFRRHPKIKFSRPYHALIDDAVMDLLREESHWRVVDLPEVAIAHYGYQPAIIEAQDKAKRARVAMESYLQDNPNDSYACSKLGALYLQLGERKKGLKLLTKGLKLHGSSPAVTFELHYHLANASVKDNQFDSAIKHYEKAIALPLLPIIKLGAYHNYASLAYQRKEYLKAIELYQECLKIKPDFPLVYYNLGLCYKALGRNFKAISAYQTAIKLNPTDAYSYQNLGLLLYRQAQYEESQQALQQAVMLHRQQNPNFALQLEQELKAIGFSFE
ncbi:Glycosyl transferase, family 2:TPR repeat:TPR repeat [Cyanobacterium sp. HL-69]|uniref:tetratricopeptide repeat protein n=1 Tax=Cyanobacterium sp. HL-69 TaxID=2054282 RepID=UPI000CA16A47|nr:Glycosyl transferase, family 2:TPR repeat:TPR repeat [Cyanobacterium sp. HL-69]